MTEHSAREDSFDRSSKRQVPFQTMSGLKLKRVDGRREDELPGKTKGSLCVDASVLLQNTGQFAKFGIAADTNACSRNRSPRRSIGCQPPRRGHRAPSGHPGPRGGWDSDGTWTGRIQRTSGPAAVTALRTQ
jgi:hypothetical protein